MMAQRNFGFLSMIAFSSTLLVTWEAVGRSDPIRAHQELRWIQLTRDGRSTFQAGLLNGGPSSLVWGFLVALVGSLALSASLAEMASMYVAKTIVAEGEELSGFAVPRSPAVNITGPLNLRRNGMLLLSAGRKVRSEFRGGPWRVDKLVQVGSPSSRGKPR